MLFEGIFIFYNVDAAPTIIEAPKVIPVPAKAMLIQASYAIFAPNKYRESLSDFAHLLNP